MRKLILVLVILVLLVALLPAAAVIAKAPLRGETTYDFLAEVYRGKFVFWIGEVTGDDIEGEIIWFGDPLGIVPTGQASHYDMGWEIWDGDVLLLAGESSGTTTARHGKNSNWRTNGNVVYAHDDFKEWLGRNSHMSGHFTWLAPGLPKDGDGILRIN